MTATLFELYSPDKFTSLDYTASATRTAGDLVVLGDSVILVPEDLVSGDDAAGIVQADWAKIPCASATASTWLIGTAIYYDEANAEGTIDSADGTNRKIGVIKTVPADNDEYVEINFDGRGIGYWPETTLRTIFYEADLAAVIAGTAILPEVTGRTYTIHRARLVFAGNAATATDIRLSDTAASPVDVLTVAVAAAGDGKVVSTEVTISNVTVGTVSEALTASKGVQIRETGTTLTGTTAVKISIDYTYSE